MYEQLIITVIDWSQCGLASSQEAFSGKSRCAVHKSRVCVAGFISISVNRERHTNCIHQQSVIELVEIRDAAAIVGRAADIVATQCVGIPLCRCIRFQADENSRHAIYRCLYKEYTLPYSDNTKEIDILLYVLLWMCALLRIIARVTVMRCKQCLIASLRTISGTFYAVRCRASLHHCENIGSHSITSLTEFEASRWHLTFHKLYSDCAMRNCTGGLHIRLLNANVEYNEQG